MTNGGHRPWRRRPAVWLWALLGGYFLLSLLFLTRFPFVHSDEAWLSGLSRAMAETGDIGTTETFFDLKPRYPHAVKLVFHLLQILFIKAGGYNIFAVRLMSLMFGTGSLVFLYRSAALLLESRKLAVFAAALLAVDVQFIYASHFARQEIVILFCMLAGLFALLKYGATQKRRYAALLCVVTGLSVGVHPNSFILAAALGCMLLVRVLAARDISWKLLPVYAASAAAGACVFVALSLWMDPDFFAHYREYGSRYEDIFSPVSHKAAAFPLFLQKLYLRISGTYYLPDIRPQFFLFALLLPAAAIAAVFWKEGRTRLYMPLAGILGTALGIILIARYNQTSAVFLFPFFYLLSAALLAPLKKRFAGIAFSGCIVGLAVLSIVNIAPWLGYDYQNYLDQIRRSVPANAKVIGNLNSEYAFENGSLRDYRNLAYIRKNGMSFADYVSANGIQYIVISEELSLFYEERPAWDGFYGELSILEEIRDFADQRCTEAGRFVNNTYGVRAVRFINSPERSFAVTVYRVEAP